MDLFLVLMEMFQKMKDNIEKNLDVTFDEMEYE